MDYHKNDDTSTPKQPNKEVNEKWKMKPTSKNTENQGEFQNKPQETSESYSDTTRNFNKQTCTN